ncbi:major capsid protein [Burkholderia thailandensis]|uniref:major capsid protein n=1 Tax=Burkholderia thailandensis TaxID=57975 RepID=UPI00016AA377|nr:major capsid protein [Burkholderia thailandensis]AIS94507.1 putative membrane protein [Burkholderia thailandensis MSMB59]AOJ44295.1 coat protein [Burkholderia thailandensis]KVG14779.1 coat protein [Burkholderia thailandensis]
MKNLSKKIAIAAGGAAAAVASSASFAQASGVDATGIVTTINGVIPTIQAVGAAVIGVVVVAWAYKTVKGFLGR